MRRLLSIAAIVLGLVTVCMPPALAEKRVALVIGNAAYRNTTPLANPKNDAADVAAALKTLGFETILETDLDKRAMDDAFRRFARLARESDAALFFYAGHAMQYAGVNYLMPTDAKLQDEADLQWEMSRVDDVIADLARARNIRIVVLDACHDNPLADRLRMALPAERSALIERGLRRVERTHGLITAFATQPGQTAKDGVGGDRNSPFTSGFLKHVATPGIEAGILFRRVAQEVSRATAGRQLPELSISLLGEFYFAGAAAVGPSAPSLSQPVPIGPCASAEAHWRSAETMGSLAAFEDHLARFPTCAFAGLARAKIDELKKPKTSIALPNVPDQKQTGTPAVPVAPSSGAAWDRLCSGRWEPAPSGVGFVCVSDIGAKPSVVRTESPAVSTIHPRSSAWDRLCSGRWEPSPSGVGSVCVRR
jgi:hypothetical protein